MSCSTIHLFLGVLCIFNIILYKSINLESKSVVEKFDIVSLQSQINLLKTQIASMRTTIKEQSKVFKAAQNKFFEEQSQKNKDEYDFQREQDNINQRLLADMEHNLTKLELQLKSELQSQPQPQNILFDLNIIKIPDNINIIINEIDKIIKETEKSNNDLKTILIETQNKYNLSKTIENKNELDTAIAGINVNEYNLNSIKNYKSKFQSLLTVNKTDENIKKILAPTHYPIAKRDPNFKNNEFVYNQQIIIIETSIKKIIESTSSINTSIDEIKEMIISYQNSTDPNIQNIKQELIDNGNKMINEIKCISEIIKMMEESFQKCLEYTKQIIYIGNNTQPTTTTPTTTPTSTLTVPPQRTASIGQSQYDIVLEIDDKLNPIYPPHSTQTPDAYNSVSEKQLNNTDFISDYKPGPNEKIVVDKIPLYYIDKEEDIKSLITPTFTLTPTSTPTPTSISDLIKKLKYDSTKNGDSIINCMVAIIVFCIMMLITTILLPYLIDNQIIISIIIIVINLAIMITVFLLTYYLFDNNVEDNVNKMNINNYKLNGMTIMGYLVAIIGLIIFFVCGVPNIFLLLNPEQSTQTISQL